MTGQWDGGACWFEETDRRADPMLAERLRDALREATLPGQVRFANLTPEMRARLTAAMRSRLAPASTRAPDNGEPPP